MPSRIEKSKYMKSLERLMSANRKTAHKKELYTHVLRLLKLEARKFELLLELVRSLAHKELEEEAAKYGVKSTTDNHEELIIQHIPWTLLPDPHRCKTSRGYSIKERQRVRVLQQLRSQVTTLNYTLQRIVDKDTGAPLASGE